MLISVRSSTRLSLLAALLMLAGCERCGASDSRTAQAPTGPVDCGEDLECYISRASSCLPTSVLYHEQVQVSGAPVRVTTRHEVVGRVRGRCHVRRTRLEPPAPPLPPPRKFDAANCPTEEDLKTPSELDVRSPPRLQCLYEHEQAAEVMRRLQQGRPLSEDLTPCQPGDGRCGRLPLLYFGCVLGECLLGRWTYTCELRGQRTITQCEGVRRPDADIGCQMWCDTEGREHSECLVDPVKWKREHEERCDR